MCGVGSINRRLMVQYMTLDFTFHKTKVVLNLVLSAFSPKYGVLFLHRNQFQSTKNNLKIYDDYSSLMMFPMKLKGLTLGTQNCSCFCIFVQSFLFLFLFTVSHHASHSLKLIKISKIFLLWCLLEST